MARVVIVGAGLAGSLLAKLLAMRGYQVEVFERRSDPRVGPGGGGRSINLALSVRGLTALEMAGLDGRVLEDAIPMRGRMMHPPQHDPTLVFQAYSKNPTDAINSVSRGGLNRTLVEAAEEHDSVTFRFDRRCVGVDFDRGAVAFEGPDGREEAQGDLVVGADGAFSAVRLAMQKHGRFNFSQDYLEHGYKELVIPPAAECGVDPALHDGFALPPNALHIWPRGAAMMIALPNADRTFTCTLFWPYEGGHSFAAVERNGSVTAFFERHYPDAVPLMPTLEKDYEQNPVGSLVTVRSRPWHVGENIVLIGDASHAIVPFFGQGMNAAFEDCRVLVEMLDEAGGPKPGLLETFSDARIPNANAIADMALENFIEMRDKVGSRWFRLRKRVEQMLHALLPGALTPRYNLVSFSNESYADTLRRTARHPTIIWALIFAAVLLVVGAAVALVAALVGG